MGNVVLCVRCILFTEDGYMMCTLKDRTLKITLYASGDIFPYFAWGICFMVQDLKKGSKSPGASGHEDAESS